MLQNCCHKYMSNVLYKRELLFFTTAQMQAHRRRSNLMHNVTTHHIYDSIPQQKYCHLTYQTDFPYYINALNYYEKGQSHESAVREGAKIWKYVRKLHKDAGVPLPNTNYVKQMLEIEKEI